MGLTRVAALLGAGRLGTRRMLQAAPQHLQSCLSTHLAAEQAAVHMHVARCRSQQVVADSRRAAANNGAAKEAGGSASEGGITGQGGAAQALLRVFRPRE